MSRPHLFVAVGVAFVALGIAAMAGCGHGCSGIRFGMTSKDGVELPHKTTLRLSSPTKLDRLELSFEVATIDVQGDPAVTGFEAVFEVREKTPGDASLVATKDSIETRSAGGNPVLVLKATIRVAPSTPVDVATNVGRAVVSGIRGVDLVHAKTDAGSAELRDLTDVAAVQGESDAGSVTLVRGTGLGEVTLSTDAGGIDVQDVHAQRASLRSDVGGVSAERSTFDHLEARTDVGSVRLKACKCKTKDLGTDVGRVVEDD